MRLALTALTLALSLAPAAQAAPVSVTQTLSLPVVEAFGSFSTGDALLAGWSTPWPFSVAAQVSRVTLRFTSSDPAYNDPALFPADDGGGIPGVELGFIDEASSSRRSIASVNAAAPDVVLTDSAGAVYAALLATLLDGEAAFSLGAFVNFPNANPAFSQAARFGDGLLSITVDGDVPARLPEPASLALAGLALAALGVVRRRFS